MESNLGPGVTQPECSYLGSCRCQVDDLVLQETAFLFPSNTILTWTKLVALPRTVSVFGVLCERGFMIWRSLGTAVGEADGVTYFDTALLTSSAAVPRL